MRTLRAWFRRLRGVFSGRRTESELAAEIRSHLELHIDDNIRAGMTPENARRAAVVKFGPVEAIKEHYRDRSRLPAVDTVVRDVRFGVRTLWRRPGFAVAATTTLALGIGANTAVFSVVDAVLLRPLPYPASERVVDVSAPGQVFMQWGPVPDVKPPALRDSPAFSAVGFYIPGAANLGEAPAVRVNGAKVSPRFFTALGVTPRVGRTFTDADVATSGRIVVISHRLWRDRLMADPLVVGRPLTLDGVTFSILGVMPPEVAFPSAADFWVPTSAPARLMTPPVPRLVARLANGVSVADAKREVLRLTGLGRRESVVKVEPLRESLVGAVRPVALAIWAASGLVLLIACINAANLLLARVLGRAQEFAVRRALGATRVQLVRQVLLESLVLSTIAAAMAVPAAIWTLHAGRVLLPAQLHGLPEIGINARTLGVTAAASAFTTLLFGLGPCLSVKGRASGGLLRAQTSTDGRFWRWFRSGLLVAEVAITMLLLIGASMLVASVSTIMQIDMGARGERAIAIELTLAGPHYQAQDRRRALFAQLREVVHALPGVEAVGFSDQLPGKAGALLMIRPVLLEGQPQPPVGVAIDLSASPGYFVASGIEVLAGRPFTDRDAPGAPPVVIVSEGFARAVGMNPAALIGSRAFRNVMDRDGNRLPNEEIVGVVRDLRLRGPEGPFEPAVYSPLAVIPTRTGTAYLVVRATGDPRALLPAIRGAVARVAPDLPLFNVKTFDEIRMMHFGARGFAMTAMVAFAALAFMLSAIGLYGVINYLVQLRTREIGIRLAIGATRARIWRQILTTGVSHGIVGVIIGIGATLALAGAVASRVPGMERIDPVVLAVLAAAVVLVATVATWIPAWRATRIDPALTLRAE